MDLLRQVLARLPVDGLLELWISDDSLVKTRLRTVNRLPEAFLDNLQVIYRTTSFYTYAMLSMLHGELNSEGLSYISPHAALDRALFTDDRERLIWYYSYLNNPSITTVNLALLSGNEEAILLMLGGGGKNIFQVIDPEIIKWTPRVLRKYEDLITKLPSEMLTSHNGVAALAGYFRIPIADRLIRQSRGKPIFNREAVLEYWQNYFLSYMNQFTDNFADRPELNQILDSLPMPSIKRSICFYAGYFPPWLIASAGANPLAVLAAKYIRPEILERLSGVKIDLRISEIDQMKITHSLVRRAYRAIEVVENLYPTQLEYKTLLQALCGLPLDINHLNPESVVVMEAVAHPQFLAGMSRQGKLPETSVRYDLVNYVRQVVANPQREDANIRMAYVEGKILQCFTPEEMGLTVEFSSYL